MTIDGFLTLAARTPDPPALEIRCNFGMFAGREATPAELDDLAHTLLTMVHDVAVVSEQRREVGPASEAALHQVRIEVTDDKLPDDDLEVERLIGRLMQETERWAESCMAERSLGVA
jgi:hypothetical protein